MPPSSILTSIARSFGVNVFGRILYFVLLALSARVLGVEQFGAYSFLIALIGISALPTQLGFPQLVLKETAKANVLSRYGRMFVVWRRGFLSVLSLSAIFLLLATVFLGLIDDFPKNYSLPIFLTAIAFVPVLAMINIQTAALKGMNYIVLGQLPEMVVRPALLILAITIFSMVTLDGNLDLLKMLMLGLTSGIATLIFVIFCKRKVAPATSTSGQDGSYSVQNWWRSGIQLSLVGSLLVINNQIGIIALGILSNDADVGIFKVVLSGSNLVMFALGAINTAISPRIAAIHSQGSRLELQKVARLAAKLGLAFAIPVALVFIAFGGVILEEIFGKEFVVGWPALCILVLGQCVNAGVGSVGVLLNMTGNQSEAIRGVVVGLLINIVLSFTLIPYCGLIGAALASCLSVIAWNFYLRSSVLRVLFIDSLPFSSEPKKIG